MEKDGHVAFRPARAGDGEAVFEVTRASVAGLARHHYSGQQIAGWMGDRTPAYYEGLIGLGNMVVAECEGDIVGFVDAEPGEVTRLFVLPGASGTGLGRRLLEVGIARARSGHSGPIRLESTVNAEAFYRRHGFERVGTGIFSHGLGGDAIEIVHMELNPVAV
ncbi:GNAT family N-acetyltransferase [Roseococcus sp.]|uniref:GNAT family N-acetyltransferase n=1 Tax=Roseococcus sp. TaxID=2109646 RepID=UPI003BAD0F38